MKKKITESEREPLKELRQIREKLSVRYWDEPLKLKKDMEEIGKKYDLKKSSRSIKKIIKVV